MGNGLNLRDKFLKLEKILIKVLLGLGAISLASLIFFLLAGANCVSHGFEGFFIQWNFGSIGSFAFEGSCR